MPQFIEADVIQKIATPAEWGTLLGTKIPYKGQIMLVSDGTGKVINIKVGDGTNNFASLEYMFDTIQANVNYVQVTSNALPTPTITSGFSVVGEGTYTKSGQANVIIPTGSLGILGWNGSVWSLSQSIDLPTTPVTGIIAEGNNNATSGDTVFKGTIKPSDLKNVVVSQQRFDKTSFRNNTSILSNGVLSAVNGSQTTDDLDIPVDSDGNNLYTHISISGLNSGGSHRIRFLNANGDIITPLPSQFTSSRVEPIPALAKKYTVKFKDNNGQDEGTPADTLMINFGNVIKPYESFKSNTINIKGNDIVAKYVQDSDNKIIDVDDLSINKGDIKVYISNTLDKWYIRIPFNEVYDLFHTWQIDPVNLIPEFNKILKLPVSTLDNEDIFASNQTIKGAEDDICPIRFENNYLLGGGHGSTVRNVTVSHNKTSADILSIWSDGGRQWRLTQIVDANTLRFIPLPYNTPNGTWVNPTLVSTTLTHVSGGTNTSSIDASISSTTGIDINTMPGRFYRLMLDGKIITESGLYLGNEFVVYDNHTIVDIRNLTPQIPFKMNEGGELFTEEITYKYDKYNNCQLDYVVNSKSSVFIEQHGFTQFSRAITSVESANQTLLYIPDSGNISNGTTTFNLATNPQNIFNPLNGNSLIYNSTNLPNPAVPVFRVLEIQQTTAGVKKNGFAHGFSIDLGITKNSNRVSLSEQWEIRGNSAKSYPSGIRKYSLNTNSVLQARIYRSVFDCELNPDFTSVYHYKEGDKFYLFIDAHKTLSKKDVNINKDLIGKIINIKQTGGNMSLLTNQYVPENGKLIINCVDYGYLVLEII